MYAIVDIAGQQMKVEKDQKIFVHLLEGDTGAPVHFNRVLLIDNDKNVLIGSPLLTDALITGKILSHVKGDKIKVFKKKRRKGYKVLKGHRQSFTEVQIDEIMEKGGIKILKDLATKKESKKEVKTEKTEKPKKIEKPKKVVKPVTDKIKSSLDKKPEIVPEAKVTSEKAAELSEKKPKKSQAKKTAKPKSSSAGMTPESKVKKPGKVNSGKPVPKTTVKPKITKTGGTGKKAATKKSDKSKNK